MTRELDYSVVGQRANFQLLRIAAIQSASPCWDCTVADTLERVDARLITPVLEAHKRTIEPAIEEA